jgi:hypothetical protein
MIKNGSHLKQVIDEAYNNKLQDDHDATNYIWKKCK